MRLENKDEALDLLFANAGKERSPIDNSATENLLHAKAKVSAKSYLNLKNIFMMTTILATLTFLFYFFNPQQKNDKTASSNIFFNEANNGIKHSEENANKSELVKSKAHVSATNNKNFTYSKPQKNASGYTDYNKDSRVDSTNKVIETKQNDIESITSTNTNLIELPEEILNRLNISFSNDGICITILNRLVSCYSIDGSTHQYPKDYLNSKPVKQKDGSVRAEVNPKYNRNLDSFRNLEPILITDDEGKNWRAMHFTTVLAQEFNQKYPDLYDRNISNEERQKAQMEFMNAELNNFIPVLIRLPEKYKKDRQPKKDGWRQDVIMWFQPTDAFLKIIKDSDKSLAVDQFLTKVADKKPNPTETGKNDTINIPLLSVYPNPVIEVATVNYNLDKDKKVNISLHDISGKLVKVFVRNEIRSAGNNTMTIDIKDIISGIYVLSIETADGNILTQRIIKQ